MKKETLEKIINGEKKTIRVNGYTYFIDIDRDCRKVELELNNGGSVASSKTQLFEYGYTHGGRVYQHAVDIAHEIASVMPEDTDE